MASDRLGMRRDLGHQCHELTPSIPTNEHFAGIFERTPAHLLHEVILYEDASEEEHKLSDYLKTFAITSGWNDKIRVERSEERQGLIRAKTLASRLATGEVIVFLDSHCEVTERWLEPLLAAIAEKPQKRRVADCRPHSSADVRLLESDDLQEWFRLVAELQMGGGGGGTWMCGGAVVVGANAADVGARCCRTMRPYKVRQLRTPNLLQFHCEWLTTMAYENNTLCAARPSAAKMDFGDVSLGLELKKRLDCKDMDWYLDNVYPELKPSEEQEKHEEL
ncbi:hypothetical protein OSTOST_15943 [Ostertagia ostertagi]